MRRIAKIGPPLFGFGVIALVGSALLFTKNGFVSDFTNAEWLSYVQSATVSHGIFPSYFINTTSHAALGGGEYFPYPQEGLFNPVFGYYGGTLFALTGWLSTLAQGHAIVGFEAMTMLGLVSSYGGWAWLARQCGCSRPLAQVPAVAFTTSAYYVTDLYGRSDWIEFMAVSALPLVVAAAVDLCRTRRARLRSAAALYLSTVIFTGSHSTTLVYGGLFVALVAAAMLVTRAVPLPTRRGFVVTAVIFGLGLATNGWELVPQAFYSGKTFFVTYESSIGTQFFDTFQLLFYPFRTVPSRSATPALYVQIPVWLLAWSLVGALYLSATRAWRRRGARAFVAVSVVGGLYLFLLMNEQVWNSLPRLLRVIQSPYLLSTYLALATAALTLIVSSQLSRLGALHVSGERGRAVLYATLGLVMAVSLGLAGWQVLVPNDRQPNESYLNRANALVSTSQLPKSWYPTLDFVDLSMTEVTAPARVLDIPASFVDAHGDGLEATLSAPAGTAPIITNLVAAPHFATVSGDVRAIGRSPAGYLVIARKLPGSGPVHIVVTTARSTGVVTGRAITAAALALVLVGLFVLMAAAMRRRRSSPPPRERPEPPRPERAADHAKVARRLDSGAKPPLPTKQPARIRHPRRTRQDVLIGLFPDLTTTDRDWPARP